MDRTVQITFRGDRRVTTEDIADLGREVAAFMAGQLGFDSAELVVVGTQGRNNEPRYRIEVKAEG